MDTHLCTSVLFSCFPSPTWHESTSLSLSLSLSLSPFLPFSLSFRFSLSFFTLFFHSFIYPIVLIFSIDIPLIWILKVAILQPMNRYTYPSISISLFAFHSYHYIMLPFLCIFYRYFYPWCCCMHPYAIQKLSPNYSTSSFSPSFALPTPVALSKIRMWNPPCMNDASHTPPQAAELFLHSTPFPVNLFTSPHSIHH